MVGEREVVRHFGYHAAGQLTADDDQDPCARLAGDPASRDATVTYSTPTGHRYTSRAHDYRSDSPGSDPAPQPF